MSTGRQPDAHVSGNPDQPSESRYRSSLRGRGGPQEGRKHGGGSTVQLGESDDEYEWIRYIGGGGLASGTRNGGASPAERQEPRRPASARDDYVQPLYPDERDRRLDQPKQSATSGQHKRPGRSHPAADQRTEYSGADDSGAAISAADQRASYRGAADVGASYSSGAYPASGYPDAGYADAGYRESGYPAQTDPNASRGPQDYHGSGLDDHGQTPRGFAAPDYPELGMADTGTQPGVRPPDSGRSGARHRASGDPDSGSWSMNGASHKHRAAERPDDGQWSADRRHDDTGSWTGAGQRTDSGIRPVEPWRGYAGSRTEAGQRNGRSPREAERFRDDTGSWTDAGQRTDSGVRPVERRRGESGSWTEAAQRIGQGTQDLERSRADTGSWTDTGQRNGRGLREAERFGGGDTSSWTDAGQRPARRRPADDPRDGYRQQDAAAPSRHAARPGRSITGRSRQAALPAGQSASVQADQTRPKQMLSAAPVAPAKPAPAKAPSVAPARSKSAPAKPAPARPARPAKSLKPTRRDKASAAVSLAPEPTRPAKSAPPKTTPRRQAKPGRSRSGSQASRLTRTAAGLPKPILASIAVGVAAAVIAVLSVVMNPGSSQPHRLVLPTTMGGYTQDPVLAAATDAQAIRQEIVTKASGEVSHVVFGVYKASGGASGNAQIVMVIAGNLASGSSGNFISDFMAKLPGAFGINAGALGGQAACVEAANKTAECAWADNDTFGVILSPTLTASALGTELLQLRPKMELPKR